MTEAYRQKLLNWWCSVTLLLLCAALGATAFWFTGQFKNGYAGGTLHLFDLAGYSAQTLVVFIMWFPIVGWWHTFDFIERDIKQARVFRAFSSYWAIFAVASTGAVCTVLITSGVLNASDCPIVLNAGEDTNVFRFDDSCYLEPPDWLRFSLLLLLLFVFILCMGKAVISIRSRLKKAL